LDAQQSQTSLVDFGDMVMGSLRHQDGYLVNNTPMQQTWKALVRKGFHSSVQTDGQLLTPYDMGSELLEKIIICHPEKGVLGILDIY
jgi:hypothetical protein